MFDLRRGSQVVFASVVLFCAVVRPLVCTAVNFISSTLALDHIFCFVDFISYDLCNYCLLVDACCFVVLIKDRVTFTPFFAASLVMVVSTEPVVGDLVLCVGAFRHRNLEQILLKRDRLQHLLFHVASLPHKFHQVSVFIAEILADAFLHNFHL